MSKPRDSLSKRTAKKRAVDTSVSQLSLKLADNLRNIVQPGQQLMLAFSGGLDSRVLLQILVDLQPLLRFELHAIHVHHGLSPNADDWAAFCVQTCADLNVLLTVVKANVSLDSGLGVEAAARLARYQAFMEAKTDYIALAHHLDDQAETLLLQLLRGSGVKGLAAMAMRDQTRRLLRPLIDVPRETLL
ncbi:MAG: tRNA lysidine(34) synthetase TilS, partial [Nitrosomonadales bacterium]|nr:tRNA lysidine(34) synthetase TilS [Nitrosomonadales bacterium]